VRDMRGYRKRLPAIVVSSDAEITADEPLVLMAITTTYPDQPAADVVELLWNPEPPGYRRAWLVEALRS